MAENGGIMAGLYYETSKKCFFIIIWLIDYKGYAHTNKMNN